MAVIIKIAVSWNVTPCILLHRHQIIFHKTAILNKYESTAFWETLNYFDRRYSDIAVSFY
jgi:hypothetical protein